MNKNIEKLLDFQYFVDPTVIPSKYVFSPTVQIQTSFSIFVWKENALIIWQLLQFLWLSLIQVILILKCEHLKIVSHFGLDEY